MKCFGVQRSVTDYSAPKCIAQQAISPHHLISDVWRAPLHRRCWPALLAFGLHLRCTSASLSLIPLHFTPPHHLSVIFDNSVFAPQDILELRQLHVHQRCNTFTPHTVSLTFGVRGVSCTSLFFQIKNLTQSLPHTV